MVYDDVSGRTDVPRGIGDDAKTAAAADAPLPAWQPDRGDGVQDDRPPSAEEVIRQREAAKVAAHEAAAEKMRRNAEAAFQDQIANIHSRLDEVYEQESSQDWRSFVNSRQTELRPLTIREHTIVCLALGVEATLILGFCTITGVLGALLSVSLWLYIPFLIACFLFAHTLDPVRRIMKKRAQVDTDTAVLKMSSCGRDLQCGVVTYYYTYSISSRHELVLMEHYPWNFSVTPLDQLDVRQAEIMQHILDHHVP